MVIILQMYMNHIVIGTDSRGRGLREYITRSNFFPQSHIHLGIFPGGKFDHVSSKALQQVDGIFRQDKLASVYCYVGAGICNLTTKSKFMHGTNINYVQNSENVANLKNNIVNFYHTTHKNGIHAKIIHIPPVSLLAYNKYSTSNQMYDMQDTISTEQAKLEENLDSINDYISKINQDYRKTSVRWDKDLKKVNRS